MRISIIAPFSFGYIDALADKLASRKDAEVSFINTGNIQFEYGSKAQKVQNFFFKTFTGKNLKKAYTTAKIKEIFQALPKQEVVLVIRPDKLEEELLEYLKLHTQRMVAYYFDANANVPGQETLIPVFDEVFSYEKEDVAKHGLKFIPNFIPADIKPHGSGEGLFNISSYDERYPVLEKIVGQLRSSGYPYRVIVRKKEAFVSDKIEIISDYLSLEEVEKYILASEILLDIQKDDQQGLSFRVMEALGYDKKLITTNKDVVNYDFFRPNNILVIEKRYPVISKEFIQAPHTPVPEEIKQKYRRDHWIEQVFGLS